MSLESLAIALHHSRATGTARLVLIGIANHDGDGGSWPSIATLSKYAGGIDRRGVQRAIAKLEDLGEIRRSTQVGGNADTPEHLRPNLYRLLLSCPPHCDRSSSHRDARKPLVQFAPDPAVESPPRGDSAARGGGDSAARGGGDSAALTILRTNPRLKEETHVIARACAQGHEIVDVSGSGVPFCAYGCPPLDGDAA